MVERGRERERERAQSELLGFLLVFTLVIGSMSVVTVAGMDQLREIRNDERVNNAERAFDILEDNLDDLVTGGVSSRATELNLANARLSFGDPVTVTVNGTEVSNPGRNFSVTYSVRPLVYGSQSDERLVYAGGATFRQDRAGVVMLNEPSLLLSPSRSNALVVQTRHVGRSSAVGGSSTVLVRTERVEADLYRVNTTTYDLSITIDSTRAVAWRRYLRTQPGTSCTTAAGDNVTCSVRTDRLYVSVVRINVLLE